MKKTGTILTIMAILAAGAWVLSLRGKYSDSLMEVERLREVVDSVRAIEATPPDTIRMIDTIRLERVKVITTFKERPPEYNTFTDSIVNEKINVRIKVTADQVFDITWDYTPIIIREKETVNKPYPVIVDNPIPVDAKGWYVAGGVSFAGGLVSEIGIYKLKNRSIFGVKAIGVKNKIGIGVTFGVRL